MQPLNCRHAAAIGRDALARSFPDGGNRTAGKEQRGCPLGLLSITCYTYSDVELYIWFAHPNLRGSAASRMRLSSAPALAGWPRQSGSARAAIG